MFTVIHGYINSLIHRVGKDFIALTENKNSKNKHFVWDQSQIPPFFFANIFSHACTLFYICIYKHYMRQMKHKIHCMNPCIRKLNTLTPY